MLNILAATMQKTFPKLGYVTPFYNYQNLVQFSLEVDENYNIKSFSEAVSKILNYIPADLIKMNFSEILAEQSLPTWNQFKTEVTFNTGTDIAVQLLFRTNQNQYLPFFCNISLHLYSNKILITSVTTILQDLVTDLGKTKSITPRKSDATIIQSVHEYIKENLEDPLPSAKELAQFFGTNEFKLKEGFRHFFNTSIYQFYNEERLKKAYSLIQKTDFPLKEIAFMSGFNDYVNFSKAFKKKYHFSPSQLKRDNDL